MSNKDKIIEIISATLEDESVKEMLENNNDLSQLQINSISFIKIVVELENEFDIEFSDEALDYSRFSTSENLCEYIEEMLRAKLE